jgi:hypothetical protein
LGDINLPTGKIIACDAFILHNEPFVAQFPTGQFPVELAVARLSNGDERVAFARIKFLENTVATWKMATTQEQRIEDLKEGHIFGYGVDSGTGCFLDEAAYPLYEKANEDFESINRKLTETYQHTWTKLLLETEDMSVAIFSSGVGDGLYASYIGYDDTNQIVELITDFYLIPWLKKPAMPLP